MILYLLYRDIPSANGVALCAIRTELPPVNIRVTICAILPHIRKNRLYVALRALHFLVHTPQGIVCMVVIEFRTCADRTPSRCCVAVFARNRERPMWAAGSLSLSQGGKSYANKAHKEHGQKLEQTWRTSLPGPSIERRRGQNGPNRTLLSGMAPARNYCTKGQIVSLF